MINLSEMLQRTSATFPRQLSLPGVSVVEEANMPSTPLTKLAMYIIAQALVAKASLKQQDVKLSQALVGKVEAIFDKASVERYGFKAIIFNPGKNKLAHWFQFRAPELKIIVRNHVLDDPRISKDEADALKAAVLFLEKPDEDSRVKNVRKLARKLSLKFGDNVVKVLDASGDKEEQEETDSKVASLTEQLKDVVKEMTGKVGVKVDTDTLNQPRNVNRRATYRQIRRDLTTLYDEALTRFLSSKGGEAYVHEAYLHMEKLGFPTHRLTAFTKKVPLKVTMTAGKLQYLTESGKPLASSIPAGATGIKFMSTYDEATGTGAYLSYTAPEAVSITRVYTVDHKKVATESKFSKAEEVTTNIDKYLTRWRKDLLSKDPYKRMGATIAMMVYETGMRAGTRQKSAASATGKATYGALSLRPRHVRISASSIIFKYEGKKGVQQEHKILLKDKWTKLLAKNLEQFKKGKKGDDLIFSFINERGTTKPMAPNRMTAYLNETGYTVGLHKIRHAKGTGLVVELLGKLKFKPTIKAARGKAPSLAQRQKAGEEWMKTKIIMPVAALLGHKNKDKLAWRTSIGSYINPAPVIKWFEAQGLRVPNWVPNKVEE